MAVMKGLFTIVALVAVVNWLILTYFIIHWGGDAMNGKVEAGRYYLGKPSHAEVSRSVFLFGTWNDKFLIITTPLAALLSMLCQKKTTPQSKRTV